MSAASKRRYMMNKINFEMYMPVQGDTIAQVVGTRGNNIHEVTDENEEVYLVSMPSKFRKSVWIRKGQFVVVRKIEEGDKVRAEIEHVLDNENVLYIRSEGKWPSLFEEEAKSWTREGKRGAPAVDEDTNESSTGKKTTSNFIDEDMLPPSGSECDSDEEEELEEDEVDGEEDDDDEDEEEDEPATYNPNRSQAPSNSARSEMQ